MAALIIEQPHALGRETARRAADDAAHRLGMRSRWEGDALRFEGKGASGTIAVSDRSVRVEVTLGLMLPLPGPDRAGDPRGVGDGPGMNRTMEDRYAADMDLL